MSMSTGEDGEAVITMIWAGVIPRVHLAERNAHLLEEMYFSLMPEPIKSGLIFLTNSSNS